MFGGKKEKKNVPSISKHDLLYLEYSFKCSKYAPKIIQYRDYKNIDYNELTSDAYNAPWENVKKQNNINKNAIANSLPLNDFFNYRNCEFS